MKFFDGRAEIVQGDITRLEVDAIVNAANGTLLGGGGVDGAIHRGAGPELLRVCRELGGCATGDAKITPGFKLPARYVIHAVGPVWQGGTRGEDEQLARCYRRSLELAAQNEVRTIAFPAISTGAFGFPVARAAQIALAEVRRGLEAHPSVRKAIFCCFTGSDRHTYERLAASY